MKQLYAAHWFKSIAAGILIGFSAGCTVIDPAEDIPSYLHIDAITLNAGNGQGTNRASITDAWIFMDGDLLGGFELPCDVPILAEGTHRFIIRGGVKMNGLGSTRAIYPSWKGWEGNVELRRGQSVTASPVVTYFTGIDFINTWMLDFEAGNSLAPEPTCSCTLKRVTGPDVYEGIYSGYMHLNNTDTTFFYGASSSGFIMSPTNDTWLEFDYRSDVAFTVGIREPINNYNEPWLEVQPNQNWTKIYIRLTDVLAKAATVGPVSPANAPYKIYFALVNPSSQAESNLYIDNIKLLK